MKKIRINANAKINLFLEVGARRADGYHDIESVMQSVTLCDTVTVCAGEEVPEGIRLECGGLYTDERNIAYRAAALFFAESGSEPRADIVIEKRIPIAAGLAGGSTDGAAVLYALNAIYDGVLDDKKLHALAARLGADVPFCLDGGTALARGIGPMRADARLPYPYSQARRGRAHARGIPRDRPHKGGRRRFSAAPGIQDACRAEERRP